MGSAWDEALGDRPGKGRVFELGVSVRGRARFPTGCRLRGTRNRHVTAAQTKVPAYPTWQVEAVAEIVVTKAIGPLACAQGALA